MPVTEAVVTPMLPMETMAQTDTRKRLALIRVVIDTHFAELIRVARLLKNAGPFKPLILFTSPYPTLPRDVKICEADGIEYIAPAPPAPLVPDKPRRRMFGILKWCYRNLPTGVTFAIREFPKYLRGELRLARYWHEEVKRLFKAYDGGIMVLAEDNPSYATQYQIRAGHEIGVPTVVFPFTIVTALEPAEAYYTDWFFSYDNPLCRVTGWLFKHWVFTHKGKKLLRVPPWTVLVSEYYKAAPPLPWTHNSGHMDALLVENQRMMAHYRREKLPETQLVLTGALYDDVLADGLREATSRRHQLCNELGLSAEKPLLLCALPPSQFPRPDCRFSDYDELVKAWIGALQEVRGWSIVLRLHPRVKLNDFKRYETENIKLAGHDTAWLVPICDLYLASVSATIRWAIACGKPVINYDCYNFNYNDYVDQRGVITIQDYDRFREELHRLTSAKSELDALSRLQENEMSDWGRLDGQAAKRVIDTLEKIAMRSVGT